ncbi:hypothetical protein EGW08_003521 [Elysia chlorotica]|uniref:Reelin domain-containing protein n=1 Tax=Elysia chlorotica TaxID=188477 RepID=A0A3S1BU28_ELYCH|nr:hypothetical protein EGW08_003521 [Elysia chlorotica]
MMKILRCISKTWPRDPQNSVTIVLSAITALCCLATHTALGFGQGSMIEESFESTYCRDGVSALSRGPVHYDLRRCGGQCSPARAPRELYRMLVNASTYSVDSVQVELRANARRGGNLRGFAVVAITDSGGTAGRWVVDEDAQEPEVLRATCDSLLEGQVIFQAQPSNERTSVTVVWNPRKTNYGSVIFRAWIVQSMDAIFVVDSPPLTNPLDGREFMEVENHFRSLLDGLGSDSEGPAGRVSQTARRPPDASGTVAVRGARPDTDRDNRNPAQINTQSRREENDGRNFTMEHFEDAFLARMASGFDLSAADPFSDFNDEVLEISDLVPDRRSSLNSRNPNLSSGARRENSTSSSSTSNPTAAREAGGERAHTPGTSPSDQRLPGQFPQFPQFPQREELRPLPGMASPGASQPTLPGTPTGSLTSQFPGHNANMMNPIRLSPGNPFTRFQTIPGQNQFQNAFNSPFGNSALIPPGVQDPGLTGQPVTGPGGQTGNFGSRNPFSGMSMLPGLNSRFVPQRPFQFQPNFNYWLPNWNAGSNWNFQNRGGRQVYPVWNSGQNLAAWNPNLVGPAANPFTSNLNTGPNHISPVTSNTITSPVGAISGNRFGQSPVRTNSDTENPGARWQQARGRTGPLPNTNNAETPAHRSGNSASLGSFSDLLQASGGWGNQ